MNLSDNTPRRTVSALLAVVTLTVLSGAAASAARAQTGSVIPILECVEPVEGGAHRAYLGYNNTTGSEQFIRSGTSRNYFLPGAVDRGQPSLYLTGERRAVFSTVIFFSEDAPTRTWHLDGATVLISADSPRCRTGAITYQGRLTNAGAQASGNYDFEFRLYDQPTGGAQVGATVSLPNVAVSNGVFTVSLDFGASALNTPGKRFLEIAVRAAGGTSAYSTLAPRQPLTDAPSAVFAVRALSASSADTARTAENAGRLGDLFASDFIRNSTSQQPSANLNIGGGGTFGGTVAANTATANGFLARGGAPGGFGADNNGYAFSGSGDNDSGLFSGGNGLVSLYTNNNERVRITDGGARIFGSLTVSSGMTVTGVINGTASNAVDATNATNVSGGFVQLPLTTGAPPATECDQAAEYGRQKVDANALRLYICTAAGWKFTVLQ